jgi:dTDP-4-dehydrorhamnose reductase
MDIDEVDIRDSVSVNDAVERVRPRIVFNTAAMTDVDGCESAPEEAFKVNALGAETAALACRRQGALLVHLSTDYVFDGASRTPYSEQDALNPLGVYGRSKAEGELAVRAALPSDHLIVRTQWLFGSDGRNFVESIIGQAANKRLLRVVSDQFGSPTCTLDLSSALIALCAQGARGVFHATNSGVVSWHGFACTIVELAGVEGVRVEPIGSAELGRPAPRPAYSALDNSKFARVAGSPLRRWEEALRHYLRRRSELKAL